MEPRNCKLLRKEAKRHHLSKIDDGVPFDALFVVRRGKQKTNMERQMAENQFMSHDMRATGRLLPHYDSKRLYGDDNASSDDLNSKYIFKDTCGAADI